MDPALVQRLVEGDGAGLLDGFGRYDEAGALRAAEGMRAKGYDAPLVAAVLAQARLRRRAEPSFGDQAESMLFTADGLEQATRPALADRHAERFVGGGVHTVYDLTAGIGSDARALAAAGLTVRAVDSDPSTAAVAAANLRRWPRASARLGRAEEVALDTLETGSGVWLDPGRRISGVADAQGRTRRVFSVAALSPSWAQVQAIAARVPATGVKLSPSFSPDARPPNAEAQWTSWRGEVLECALWSGPLVRFVGRSAAVCRPNALDCVVTESDCPPSRPSLRSLAALQPWLYEADRALVSARLTSAVVGATDGVELATGIGLTTAAKAVDLGFGRRFAVLEAMPLHVKSLRVWLRQRRVGRVTVKKRGCPVNPETFRRRLSISASDGAGHALLLLTRVAGDSVVLVLDGPA